MTTIITDWALKRNGAAEKAAPPAKGRYIIYISDEAPPRSLAIYIGR